MYAFSKTISTVLRLDCVFTRHTTHSVPVRRRPRLSLGASPIRIPVAMPVAHSVSDPHTGHTHTHCAIVAILVTASRGSQLADHRSRDKGKIKESRRVAALAPSVASGLFSRRCRSPAAVHFGRSRVDVDNCRICALGSCVRSPQARGAAFLDSTRLSSGLYSTGRRESDRPIPRRHVNPLVNPLQLRTHMARE